jgi:hypothetical protein
MHQLELFPLSIEESSHKQCLLACHLENGVTFGKVIGIYLNYLNRFALN